MFDKLKNLNEMMRKAKEVKSALSQINVESSAANGKIKMTFDGENMLRSLSIDDEYMDISKKAELEKHLKSCIQDGVKKSQQEAAKKMKDVMGMDISGMF